MKPGNIYKHIDCTDVAIHVLKRPVLVPEKKVYSVRIAWLNVANKNREPLPIGTTETVTIKLEDMAKWEELPA